jgi:DNA-binding LytR/AlgR family response regulator
MHGDTPCGPDCPFCSWEPFPVQLAGQHTTVGADVVRWVEETPENYSRLHVGMGAFLVPYSLAEVEERWKSAGFIRIHESFLVPISRITELKVSSSGYSVVIGDSDKELPVEQQFLAPLKDRLVREHPGRR